jgi:hypothetical protein
MKYFPDFRRTINELQRYGVSGSIDSGILVNVNDVSVGNLMSHLKLKDFRKMRQWVADNIDIEPAAMFRKIYDSSTEYVNPQSIPQLILILADYQYKDSFVADHELNMVACLTEIMAGVEFK